MPIEFKCPCSQKLRIKSSASGKRITCPKCGRKLIVPGEQPEQAPSDALLDQLPDLSSLPPIPEAAPLAGQAPPSGLPPATGQSYSASQYSPSQAYSAGPQKTSGAIAKKPLIIAIVAGLVVTLGVVVAVLAFVLTPLLYDSKGQGARLAQEESSNRPGMREQAVEEGKYTTGPVDEAECLEAAEKYAAAIEQGDPEAAKGLIDFQEIFRRATQGVDVPAGYREGFIRGALGETANGGFERSLANELQGDSSYRVLRAHRVGNETAVWLRSWSETSGINYHDLVFARAKDGSLKVVDLLVLSSGERMSQTMRQLYIPAAASANRTLLQRLTGADSHMAKYAEEWQTFAKLTRTDPRAAIAAYQRLPQDLREMKGVAILLIKASRKVGESERMQAIAELRRIFPNDLAAEFLSIDWYKNQKNYDKALESIDIVEKTIGGDPFLDLLRADIYREKKDFDAAMGKVQNVIDAAPYFLLGYRTFIGIALECGEFDRVLEKLKLLDERFEIEWSDFGQDADYQEFVASPQYQEWLNYLKSVGKG